MCSLHAMFSLYAACSSFTQLGSSFKLTCNVTYEQGLLDIVIKRVSVQANPEMEDDAVVLSLHYFVTDQHVVCRLNAETESNTKENAGKLLAHIGRSRVSPLTSLLPQHLQPMLEKAFAAQQGSQLKQVITVFGACSTSAVQCKCLLMPNVCCPHLPWAGCLHDCISIPAAVCTYVII